MSYSQDWFTHNIPNFQHIMKVLPESKAFLEIGCFEGRASCWMLNNGLADDGVLVCVDTFAGSEEHDKLELTDLRKTFDANIAKHKSEKQTVTVIQDMSYKGLADLIHYEMQFDFIYIDGSHTAPDVMTDACMAFGLLKSGGIMLFDDYLWTDMPGLLHRPKLAVDLFCTLFSEKSELLMLGYQLAIKKL